MKIECKLGLVNCDNPNDVERILRECAADSDDIWIFGESEYPCLAIPVGGEKAVVHYFLTEQEGHYQSVGDRDADGTTTFLAGGDRWDAPNDIVVPLSVAIECVKQFLATQERPTCVEWDEI